jgi:DNA adenine methylase
VTYDHDDRVPTSLYPGRRCAAFDIAHTAAVQHVGSEYAVFADSVKVTSLEGLGRQSSFVV